jgi:hypothetical protein
LPRSAGAWTAYRSALELAARARTLAHDGDDAARLHDRFRLLTQGDRTALPRQQTLRACIDWSYDLFPSRARVAAHASRVRGRLGAARRRSVGAEGSGEASTVVDLLDRLVQKSLVEFDAEADRYPLLETVRQYATERPRRSGEEARRERGICELQVTLTSRRSGSCSDPSSGHGCSGSMRSGRTCWPRTAGATIAENGGEIGLWLVGALRGIGCTAAFCELGSRITDEALSRASAPTPGLQRCWALLALRLDGDTPSPGCTPTRAWRRPRAQHRPVDGSSC